MTELVERLRNLAEHVERAEGADEYLNRDIHRLISGDMWARLDSGPNYTASLDAVRTLIDHTDEWELSTMYCIARATVGLNRDHQTSWPGYGEHAACDPVLALLAAALRARAAQTPERSDQ
jgi:hypothetical protein